MQKQSVLSEKQEKAIDYFFECLSSEDACELLDDIFNYSLEIERQGTATEFCQIRQIKALIAAIDPAKQ